MIVRTGRERNGSKKEKEEISNKPQTCGFRVVLTLGSKTM